ncbi:MAG TPA: response regulator [Verrucomicrobiae bacterium]
MKNSLLEQGVVLIAEDDDNDAFLLRRALDEMSSLTVRIVSNGSEAQNYLRGEGKYSDRSQFPIPDVIVCDYNMPICNGVEFAQWLRNTSQWNDLSLIFFSVAWAPHQVKSLVELGVDLCLRKEADFNRLLETAHVIHQYVRRGRAK